MKRKEKSVEPKKVFWHYFLIYTGKWAKLRGTLNPMKI